MRARDVTPKGGLLDVIVASEKNGKEAKVFMQRKGEWSIKYRHNGRYKHGFESYQAAIDYLKKAGW